MIHTASSEMYGRKKRMAVIIDWISIKSNGLSRKFTWIFLSKRLNNAKPLMVHRLSFLKWKAQSMSSGSVREPYPDETALVFSVHPPYRFRTLHGGMDFCNMMINSDL